MNFILRMMIFIVFSVYLIIAGEIETTYYGLGKLTGVKYSPDGKYIATYGSKGICLVNPESMTPGRLIARGIGEITQIDFSPDGQQIALLKKDKSAAVVDILNDNVRILTGSAKQTKIQWSTAGDIIVASSSDTTIRLWDANNLTLLNEIKIDTTINDFSINPEGDIIGVTQR
ncbi:MAG: Por Secre tail protein, partial [Bacteroidota bacterium]|nr:Por Secre tail protein [Bacteroidota bacterium]